MKPGLALFVVSLTFACQETSPPPAPFFPQTPPSPPQKPPPPEKPPPPPPPTEEPPPPPEVDETQQVFDDSLVHEIEIEVGAPFLGELRLDNEERVPSAFTFDGIRLEEVGVRLKGHGSGRELTGKASFSVKFNEFVSGQKLLGLKKLLVNNTVGRASFSSRPLGYEIWRRAGVPSPRTAYARVSFNGEYFGLYIIEEAYNSQFLERHFVDSSGNLYEGEKPDGWGAEITDVDDMDLDTNEEINDRSDLIALRDVVLNTPDEALLEALSPMLDIEQFITYWAVERLVYHWDGYGTVRQDSDCCSPHNYTAYHDPLSGLFTFMPRGIDRLFELPRADVGLPPRDDATMAARLYTLPEVRAMLAERMEQILDEVWEVESLLAYLDAHAALALDAFVEGGREEITRSDLEEQIEDCRDFIEQRADFVRARLVLGL